MATLAEVKAEVESLKADLDAEQEQIKAAIDALNAVVAKLQEDVAGGGTAEDREALLNDIKAIRDDLKATIADEPTEPEA